MLSLEEQRTLIEKYIKSNKNYQGNEDLFEDFCNESLQKSYMVFNSTVNIQKVESYLSKVVYTSILSVLKENGRVRKDGYMHSDETKMAVFNRDLVGSSFISNFPDPKETEKDILITKECIQRIADAVCIIHKEAPGQQFLDIFCLRYLKGLRQFDIGNKLGLSQSEVSRRLMQLSKLISNVIGKC